MESYFSLMLFRVVFLETFFWYGRPILHLSHYTKKWSFPLRISSVNVSKSTGNLGLGHIYWRNPEWKTSLFVQCLPIFFLCMKDIRSWDVHNHLQNSIFWSLTQEGIAVLHNMRVCYKETAICNGIIKQMTGFRQTTIELLTLYMYLVITKSIVLKPKIKYLSFSNFFPVKSVFLLSTRKKWALQYWYSSYLV